MSADGTLKNYRSVITSSGVVTASTKYHIVFTYDGTADTDFRVDSLVYRFGEIFKIAYYSKYLFRSSAGTFQEKVSDDTDLINLDVDSYNLMLLKTMDIVSQELQGEDSGFDLAVADRKYKEALKL